MKKYCIIMFLAVVFGCGNSNNDTAKIEESCTDGLYDYPISPVNSNQIELTDNFWLPKIKTVQNTTIRYALDKCEKEGRMDNFLIAGGVKQGETRGAMPFDDTDVYKIIEGAANSLIMAPDEILFAYIDSIISIIKTGQEEDGYLTTWRTINPQKPPAQWVKPGERWENLGASHELYNSGHLFEAAATHYYATGKRNFLDIALENADLLVETFGSGKNPELPGHQIIETGLIKLYRITREKKYLELAKHFLDQRGDSTNRKLFGSYSQDHLPVTQQDEVVGHAVRAVYMYAGMTDIAAIYRDSAYLSAVNKLWENMVNKKMYITGGIGARHQGESFGDNYELPNQTAYSETCAAIGSVYWNHRLFLLTGDSKYFDIIERTLYNGVISGISLTGDKFFYPNPLESDGEYKFNNGACTRQPWFDCSCCPSNLIRFIPSVPNLIYATESDSLYINLYVSNKATVEMHGSKIHLVQETEYPWDGKINITVDPEMKSRFTINLRIPGWAENIPVPGDLYYYLEKSTEKPVVTVNGKKADQKQNKGYLQITKEWNKGDKIEIELPMKPRRVVTNKVVEENKNKVAVEYGPIVYCAEEADNPTGFDELNLTDSDSCTVEMKAGMLGGIDLLTLETSANEPKNNPVVMIPYYTWSNRGEGKMKVWLPRNIEE